MTVFLPILGQLQAQPKPGAGRFVCVGLGTYATPKWDPTLRVPGSLIVLQTYGPNQAQNYWVSAYAQYQDKKGEWNDFLPRAGQKYKAYIGRLGKVRDTIMIEGRDQASVSLFVPNEVLGLTEPLSPIRFQIRFFNAKEEHIKDLDVSLPLMNTKVVKVQLRSETIIIAPDIEAEGPVLLYDVNEKKYKDYDK
jgi:hypothetical protein